MPTDKLNVKCSCCIPNSPFYLRWINRYGAWEYWMFEKRQTYEYDQGDVQLYNPYISDFSQVSGTTMLVSKEVEETVLIGAENLTANEWRVVTAAVKSAAVQWYNKEREQWVDVILSKQKAVLETDSTYNALEFTLTLPTPQLAI